MSDVLTNKVLEDWCAVGLIPFLIIFSVELSIDLGRRPARFSGKQARESTQGVEASHTW